MYPEHILNGLITPEQGMAFSLVLLGIGIAMMYVGWKRMHAEQPAMQEAPSEEHLIQWWLERRAS